MIIPKRIKGFVYLTILVILNRFLGKLISKSGTPFEMYRCKVTYLITGLADGVRRCKD